MRPTASGVLGMAALVWVLGVPSSASAQFYAQHNLRSDGSVPADVTDPDLVNAWGLAASATSPFWVADNGTDRSTLYNGNTNTKLGLIVSVPGAPTGVVFNVFGAGFPVDPSQPDGPKAIFLFDTEEGTIRGWNPALGTTTSVPVDNASFGAVYKGLAVARISDTEGRLYATNFRAGTVDVYDSNWMPITGGFVDPAIPPGFAPFGIQNIDGTIYVTYALQDEDKEDDVAGQGNGYVDAYDLQGNLIRRVASGGVLNSPWGIALAPADFGKFSNDLLIGNFGDGKIHAFATTRPEGNGQLRPQGQLHAADGRPLVIDGLWALQFGNGGNAGPATTLFFTAGPNDESGGLFGSLVPSQPNLR